jgi:membrane-associated PAP2 superfamily phosphatase
MSTETQALIPHPANTFSVMLLLGVLLLCLEQWTNLDMRLSEIFYSVNRGSFVWQHQPIGKNVYQLTKQLAIVLALGFCFRALYLSLARQTNRTLAQRQTIYFISLVALTEPMIVWLFREYSASHCPRALVQFGGENLYYHLLDSIPSNTQLGRCNPSGHASSFLWMPSMAVLYFNEVHTKSTSIKAKACFLALIVFALTLAFVQVLRGEHFFSHILWSAWIATAWCFSLLYCFQWQFLKDES